MRVWFVIGLLVLSACGARLAAEPLTEPPDLQGLVSQQNFGDARNVQLLSALAGDREAAVREQAILDLGDTHNDLAVPWIVRAAGDSEADVRIAAALAAQQLSPAQAMQIITLTLKDDDPQVVLAGLQCVRALSLSPAAAQVRALLPAGDKGVRAAAVATLTALGLAADEESLRGLLGEADQTLRLRALENALLLARAQSLTEILRQLAQKDVPGARGLALEAMGKFNYLDAASVLEACAKDPSPLVRLGVVRAYDRAGQGRKALPFLNDKSEAVRLGSIRAAGAHKCAEAVTDLFRLMFAAPMDELAAADSHLAARDSLIAIGNAEVSASASSAIPTLRDDIADVDKRIADLTRQEDRFRSSRTDASDPEYIQTAGQKNRLWILRRAKERNIAACCRLLGALNSKAALDTQIALLRSLPTDSPILRDLVWSLGQMDDARVLPALLAFADTYTSVGQQELARRAHPDSPAVPYLDDVAAEVVYALAHKGGPQAFERIHTLARVHYGVVGVREWRLEMPAIAAARVYPKFIDKDRRKTIEEDLIAMADRPYLQEVRYAAIKQVGRLRLAAAVPTLERELKVYRRNKTMMQAAAWAIQQIAGKAPAVGEPIAREGDWIIQIHRNDEVIVPD